MPLSTRFRFALAGSAAVLVAGALAVPWYSAYTLAEGVRNLASAHAQGEMRIRNLAHVTGWMRSQGALDVEWHSPCAAETGGPVVVRVEYSAGHLPDLRGGMHFEWSAVPGGPAAADAQAFLRGGTLTGNGRVALDGTLSTDMRLPELGMETKGGSWLLAPSQGRLVLGTTSLLFDWSLERIAFRGQSGDWEARQLALRLDLNQRAVGTGRMTLDVERLSAGDLLLQGMRLRSETTERADRLDSKVTESVRSAQFMGQNLKDLVLQAEVKGLHTSSAQTLSRILGDTCGLQRATGEQKQQWRAAIQKLMASGFSLGIPALQGAGPEGRVDASFLLTLAPAQGDALVLAEQLSSRGQVTVTGNFMPPEQKAFALSTGYVTDLPDGIQAGFEYGAGVLTVSGKPLDSAVVQQVLQKLDAWLGAFLAGESLALPEDEPPLFPPMEAPAAVPAPSPVS